MFVYNLTIINNSAGYKYYHYYYNCRKSRKSLLFLLHILVDKDINSAAAQTRDIVDKCTITIIVGKNV